MAERGVSSLIDFSLLKPLSARQMAIDIGTSNTVIHIPGDGIVLNEPSIVALEIANGVEQVRAVGADAKILMGKTADNIRTCRPLSDGVISDLGLTEEMIKHFIAKATVGPSLMSRGKW